MLNIYLARITCVVETDEVGADEPYVLVTAVNLAATVPVAGFNVPLPAFDVFRYGPFCDVDVGETHTAPGVSKSFWGIANAAAPLSDPNQAIFVVGLKENDEDSPEGTRGIVKGLVAGSLFGSLALPRGDKVSKLIADMNAALETPSPDGLNFDEKIGRPQELRFSAEELAAAEAGQPMTKTLEFKGDGGHYALTFEAVNVDAAAHFTFRSAPAAVASANAQVLRVAARGQDNRICLRASDNGGASWSSAWQPIGAGTFNSEPALAASSTGQQLHAFGRGLDNKIWRAYSSSGGSQWELAWAPIGEGVFSSGPAAAVSADGRKLHVFGRGQDNRIWRAFSGNGGTSWDLAWDAIGAGVFASGPAAVLSSDGSKLHVFGLGLDNKIWRAFSGSGGASWDLAWAPIGSGQFTSGRQQRCPPTAGGCR